MVKSKASVLVQLDADDVGDQHLYICKEIPIIVVEWGL